MSGQGGWPMTVFLDPDGVPVLRRHLLPARREPRDAELPDGDGSRRRRLREPTRRDPRAGAAARGRGSARSARSSPAETAAGRGACSSRRSRACASGADRTRGGFGGAPKFPPASALELLLARGETGRGRADPRRDAGRRHLRPARRRLRPLLGRRRLARPPLREDALRQRAAGARLPARLAGARPRPLPARLRGDAGLDAGRDARPRGRLLLGPRRRLRGRGGPLLRLDAGGDPRGPRRRAPRRRSSSTASPRRGNFEGANILHLAGGADPPSAPGLADEARRALYEARDERVRPGLDDKRLTSWNALAIAALAEAGAALGREDYLDAARSCAEFVLG